jgi:hypothetical protein
VSFHTFSLPEDRCVRLLVKKLGRLMPEDVVREELENLGIRVQGVLQLRLGHLNPDTALHCVGAAGTRGGEGAFPD